MGLTSTSTGAGALGACAAHIGRRSPEEKIAALAGNPNVGKSTVFNALTGSNQHTGNWPGKTVAGAQGRYRHRGVPFLLADLPGTYSLLANSSEEEIARDFICFGGADAVIVVADATCLERNLNLVLQTLEMTHRVVLCVNLMDEAKKKEIRIDLPRLSALLGIPVVGASARAGEGLAELKDAVLAVSSRPPPEAPPPVTYGEAAEEAAALLAPALETVLAGRANSRWAALRLLDGDTGLLESLRAYLGADLLNDEKVAPALAAAQARLARADIPASALRDLTVTALVRRCEALAREVVTFGEKEYAARDRRIDQLLTARLTGIPIMLALLFGIFWLTITGANVPSGLLADALFSLEAPLSRFFAWLSAPAWLRGLVVDGVFRTLAWVVSVMLPPMAIFFPLFTLLEDLGYLPRVAFNLDNFFRKAHAHGKQALTMCMGNLCCK